MNDREDLDSLQQELRDERARRREAEARVEDLTARADLWRRRAEERTARIEELLEAEKQRRTPLGRWLRRVLSGDDGRASGQDVTAETDAAATRLRSTPTSSAWPAIKSVMAVAVVTDPGLRRAVSSFDTRTGFDLGDSDLERADLVIVDPGAIGSLEAGTNQRLRAWAKQKGRQPLVVWTTIPEIGDTRELLRPEDVVIAAEAEVASALGVDHVPGCFDPGVHNPMSTATAPHTEAVIDRANALGAPPLEVIEAAACGVALTTSRGAETAARRWAYRRHAPWMRAREILELAGVPAPDPLPRIAAVLISHRAQSVPDSVALVMGQSYPRTELVVGLHGATVTPEIEEALARAPIPVELLELDPTNSLGECLNRAIAKTSAPVLAKIDDDDHYGPAHLEDSFHALAYSKADIVGKAAQYVYLAERDTTVLRRPGQEEMLIDGSPNGATLVFRRRVWEDGGFPDRPRHVDTGFLRAARSVGARVYAGSRWEFCYVRRPQGHTWDAEDSVFLAGSEPAWDGFKPGEVEVPDVGSS